MMLTPSFSKRRSDNQFYLSGGVGVPRTVEPSRGRAQNRQTASPAAGVSEQHIDSDGEPVADGKLVNLVTPNRLLPWYRRLVVQKFHSSRVRKVGRPGTKEEMQELILHLVRENRSWSYTRIQGALANLRSEVSRTTIARVLHEAGLEPAPVRRKAMS